MARFAVGVSLSLAALRFSLIVLFTSLAIAQNPIDGIQPFSTDKFGVDLASSNVHTSIPLHGGISLVSDSNAYLSGAKGWIVTNGFGDEPQVSAIVEWSAQKRGYCNGHDTDTITYGYVVVDGNNTRHPLPSSVQSDLQGCYVINGTYQTTDGSGYTAEFSNNTVTALYDKAGDNYVGGLSNPDGVYLLKESYSYGSNYTQTVYTGALSSTPVLTSTDYTDGTSNTYTYTNSACSGGTCNYALSFVPLYIWTAFSCSGDIDINSVGTTYFPSTLTTPTGGTYTFKYEQTPGKSASYTTGRLAKIIYPSGGWISYAYSDGNGHNGMNCNSLVVPTITVTVNDNNGNNGTWTYVNSNNSSTPGNYTVTETDPAGNQTVYSFAGEYQTQAAYYHGSASGTPLKIVMICYNGNNTNCATPSSVPALPITETNVYTNWNSSSPTIGKLLQTNYDSYGNVTSVVEGWNGGGIRTTITSRGSWNGSSCTQPIGTYIYDRVCEVIVEPYGGSATSQTAITYNNTGHPTSIARWLSGPNWFATTNTYNSNGTLATSTDPAGNKTSYAYNGTGGCNNLLVTSTTYAMSSVGSDAQQWNCNGGVMTQYTDVNNNNTTYSYNDPLWRLTNVTNPDGGSFSTSYNTGSSLPWTVTSSWTIASGSPNVSSVATLDGLGRTVTLQSTDPNASGGYRYRNTAFNNLGQVYTVSNPFFTTSDETYGLTAYSYDALGRTTQVTFPSGSYQTASYNGVAYSVTLTPTTGQNFIKIYQLDALGRVVDICEVTTQTQADGSSPTSCGLEISGTGFLATASYDVLNNLTGLTYGPSGQNRTFTYDALSRSVSETYPESGTRTYTYDTQSIGDLYTRTAPLENQTGSATVVTTYTHDAMHRLTGISYNDGITPNVGLVYDQSTGWQTNLPNGKGRLSWMSTSLTAYDAIFGYDTMGRVSVYGQCSPQGCNLSTPIHFIVNRSYNYIGEPKNEDAIDGVSWTNTYNSIGQLTQIYSNNLTSTSAGDLVSGITYNALGQRTSDLLGNGVQESWHYNVNGSIVSYASTPSVLSYALGWTGTSELSNSDDTFNGHWNYTYDDFFRLATATNANAAFSYSYDRWGNRWKQTVTAGSGPSFSQSFSTNNQISGSGYAYDAAGNMTNDTFHVYSYDAEGRLIKVDGGTTATYVYNSRGLRAGDSVGNRELLFSIDRAPAANIAAGTSSVYFNDYYVGRHWAAYQGGGAPAATLFYHQNWLGTDEAMSNLNGINTNYCKNFMFGEQSCTPNQQNFTFTGFIYDSADNLYHTDFRQQSPAQGRWTTPDPAGLAAVDPTNPQSWNRYAYALNNPVSLVDPFGLRDCGPSGPGLQDQAEQCEEEQQSLSDLLSLLDFTFSLTFPPDLDLSGLGDILSSGLGEMPSLAAGTPDDPLVAQVANQQLSNLSNDVMTPGIQGLFHAPGMARLWNSANTWGNMAAIGTVGALALPAAVGAPAAASTVANTVGYYAGYTQGAFAGSTGVLLGKWVSESENYIIDAQEMNLSYFNVGNTGWKILNYLGDANVANQGFLDKVVQRGVPIYLGSQPVGVTGQYAWELQYLFNLGVPNGALFPAW